MDDITKMTAEEIANFIEEYEESFEEGKSPYLALKAILRDCEITFGLLDNFIFQIREMTKGEEIITKTCTALRNISQNITEVIKLGYNICDVMSEEGE